MTHVTYFRISLLFPIIIGAVIGYLAFVVNASTGILEALGMYILILSIGHAYIAIPYIIYALIFGIKLGHWSVKKTILYILLTPVIFVIIATLIAYTIGIAGLNDVTVIAAMVSAISGIFYASLILGLYFLGIKLGWIVNIT